MNKLGILIENVLEIAIGQNCCAAYFSSASALDVQLQIEITETIKIAYY